MFVKRHAQDRPVLVRTSVDGKLHTHMTSTAKVAYTSAVTTQVTDRVAERRMGYDEGCHTVQSFKG